MITTLLAQEGAHFSLIFRLCGVVVVAVAVLVLPVLVCVYMYM